MSRHDKSNKHSGKPDFKEFSSKNTENRSTPTTTPKPEAVVFDPDENEDSTNFMLAGLYSIGSFFGKCWGWCRSAGKWTWGGLRKIASYCVIRWDDDEEKEEKTPVEAKKPEVVKAEKKVEQKPKPAPAKDDFDEDEVAPSRWWSIGIKTAAATLALLILAGGYFAIKPLLFKSTTGEVVESTNEMLDETAEYPLQVGDSTVNENSENIAYQAPEIPFVQELPKPELSALDLPSQGSLLDKDPFFAQTPTVAEAAPPVAHDPFSTTNAVAAPPAPAIEKEPLPTLSALQPLAALEPIDSKQSALSQLQPLVALDSSALPPRRTEVASAPVATPASANAPVAGKFADRRAQSTGRNNTYSQAPTPPPVNNMPQTTVRQTLPIIEPVKEIVPLIPASGTVQSVPPPAPTAVEVAPTRSVYANETAPAIPKDAPPADTSVSVVTVPATLLAGTPAPESSPRILSADSQPIDRQLRERMQELRNDPEPAPANLRFHGAVAASEPALRFRSRQTPPPALDENNLLSESASELQGLLPSSLPPNSTSLDNDAPKPAWAVAQPAYRNDQAAGEKGMTFQNRIDSEIKRSPSSVETYSIQQGDTYMTISDKFYGTSLLYTALAAHNQQLGIGWRPAEGVVIEIPTAEYLRLHYGESTQQQERLLESQRSAVRYTVQEGDTVFRLATDKLQDSTRWREIYAINADRIQDVRNLKPGMEILLPVRRL